MLNLRRLEVFDAVVRRGSFSAAADALSYTQSAVSQSIARLESEVGAPLVVRGRRGVTPTGAGERLLHHAGRILAEVRAAESELAAVVGDRLTRLRIASFPSGGAALMPPAVARLRRAHPDVALTLTEGEPEQIAPRLRDGELDLALLFDFPDGDGDGADRDGGETAAGLAAVTLLREPMDLVLPAGHALAGRRSVRLGDLRGAAWVQTTASSSCARHVVRCCRAAGFAPDVAFESDDYDTVQGLVAAGVGVALVPRLALRPPRSEIVVRALAPASPVRRITAATPARIPSSPAARTMIAELREVARRHGGAADPA